MTVVVLALFGLLADNVVSWKLYPDEHVALMEVFDQLGAIQRRRLPTATHETTFRMFLSQLPALSGNGRLSSRRNNHRLFRRQCHFNVGVRFVGIPVFTSIPQKNQPNWRHRNDFVIDRASFSSATLVRQRSLARFVGSHVVADSSEISSKIQFLV